MKTIDLNCDVGEGIDNEKQLMPLISSCNIACGAHAGSIQIIDDTIQLAIENNVKIGAHPSYPDRENFGRVQLEMSADALQQSIEEQLKVMLQRLTLAKAPLHHIKAHGALYNVSAKNEQIAKVLVRAIVNTVKNAQLYVPYNSEIEKVALQHGLQVIYEAFADRNYNDDLSLVSRTESNAIITDEESIVKHVMSMVENSMVTTINGTQVPIKATTFCVHGDNPKALFLVKHLVNSLQEKNINVK